MAGSERSSRGPRKVLLPMSASLGSCSVAQPGSWCRGFAQALPRAPLRGTRRPRRGPAAPDCCRGNVAPSSTATFTGCPPAGRTNWPKTLGQPQGTLSQYVNLQVLKTLQASVTATAATTHRGGPDGAGLAAAVMITNTSAVPTVGFFLRADVRRGTAAGTELAGDNELQSSIWNDNEITLWPGEWQTLTAACSSADLATLSSAFRDGTGRRSTLRHRHRDVPGPGAADLLTLVRWR
jgi:Exo-beta-D-glucosaminidase Ig-fold domain